MSLNVANAKLKLQPYILRFIEDKNLEWLSDSEFVDLLNTVANDMNKGANIHMERYYKKTTADINYYEMPGDIAKVTLFVYKDSVYQEQMYAITQVSGTPFNSLIVLKETPTDEIQMDIRYLRQVLEVTDTPTDEIDIPDRFLSEFLDAVRIKVRVDFGNENPAAYDSYLDAKCRKIMETLDPIAGQEGIRSWWPFDSVYDDSIYDITEQRVSADHIQANEDGVYTWVD